MDGFRYIEVHKNEESPFKALRELLNGLNETHPEIVEGMNELCKSGILETTDFQAKMREAWQQGWE
jgi:hypothetical protein